MQPLLVALLIAVKFFLVGAGWGCWLGGRIQEQLSSGKRYVLFPALCMMCSTLATLLVSLLLVSLERFHPPEYWSVILLFALIGVVLFVRDQPKPMPVLRYLLPGLAVYLIANSAVLGLKDRGEWMLGGWDPGVYVNQGVSMARTGSHYISDLTFLDSLTEAEQAMFRIDEDNRKQFAPGVLVDRESNRIGFQFFPLTPTMVANLYHCGGVEASLRLNHVMAILALFQLAAFLILVTDALTAIIGVLLLMIQPIFVWHLQEPISEMMQQFIVFAMLTCFTLRSRSPVFSVLTAVCMLAALLNRFSFLPFAAILIACGAWTDRLTAPPGSENKPRLMRVLGIVAMLVFAAYLSWVSAPVAVGGWGSISKGLMGMAAGAVLLALIPCLWPEGRLFRSLRNIPAARIAWCWVLWGLLIYFAPRYLFELEETVDRWNLSELTAYVGFAMIALSWLGCVLAWRTKGVSPHFREYMTFATAVMTVLMLRKFIEPLYPWATRRYLHVVIPFLVIMSAFGFRQLIRCTAGFRWKAILPLAGIAIAILVHLLPLTKKAWRGTEFNGTHQVLAQVDELLPDNALLLVDHFLYATPLTCMYGRDVLVVNGLHMGDKELDEQKVSKALEILKREAETRPVYVFTITRAGLKYFPVPVEVEGDPILDQTLESKKMIHHRKRHPFEREELIRRFRLYEFRSA